MAVFAVIVAEYKRFAVGTLNNCGVLLMCAHADLVESAITLTGVIRTLLNGTSDRVVTLLFHFFDLLFIFLR